MKKYIFLNSKRIKEEQGKQTTYRRDLENIKHILIQHNEYEIIDIQINRPYREEIQKIKII